MLKFTKMHGLGNDYVYINAFSSHVEDPPALARVMADRHRGVGGDGLILICPPKSPGSAARMEMYNADGSRSEMCGNGIRCVAKYVVDHALARPSADGELAIDTDAGLLRLHVTQHAGQVTQVRVDMGRPRLAPAEIPTTLPGNVVAEPSVLLDPVNRPAKTDAIVDLDIRRFMPYLDSPATEHGPGWPAKAGFSFGATCISMGNPHVVFFCHDVSEVPLETIGTIIENHPVFPKRINVHVVQVHTRSEVTMRTWERGSGITQACGTGASAVCVAGVLTGRSDRAILAHLPGGDLHLEWPADDAGVFMTGPATEVFSGEWRE